jgi:hypothetical protein
MATTRKITPPVTREPTMMMSMMPPIVSDVRNMAGIVDRYVVLYSQRPAT